MQMSGAQQSSHPHKSMLRTHKDTEKTKSLEINSRRPED